MNKHKLAKVEQHIFEFFAMRRTNRVLTKEIFDGSPQYANADIVRAFEDLENRWRLLTRYTEEGDDWVQLTPEGVSYIGSDEFLIIEDHQPVPHPPKSSPE